MLFYLAESASFCDIERKPDIDPYQDIFEELDNILENLNSFSNQCCHLKDFGKRPIYS